MKIVRRFGTVERSDIVQKSRAYLWSDEGEAARDYLINERDLSEDIVRSFGIGYLPEDLNHQLHGRIIMPLLDPSGNLVSITSRVAREPRESDLLPVYWHEAYEKSWYLYGMQLAKESIKKRKFVIIVEGQFDVIQMHNHNMMNTVGLCSTNLSDMQLSILSRYCDEIVLLLDNDKNRSGQKAVEKIMNMGNKFVMQTGERENDAIVDSIRYVPEKTQFSCGYKIAPCNIDAAKDPDEFIRRFGFTPLGSKLKKTVRELRSHEFAA